MSDQPAQNGQLGKLFENLTGTSTVTEQQQIDIPNRINNLGVGGEISEYVGSTLTANGLEDVIEVPESY